MKRNKPNTDLGDDLLDSHDELDDRNNTHKEMISSTKSTFRETTL